MLISTPLPSYISECTFLKVLVLVTNVAINEFLLQFCEFLAIGFVGI